MDTITIILYALTGLGLMLAVLVLRARTRRARRGFAGANLALLILGSLAVLLPALLVSRLTGSRPPGLGEVLAPYAVPLVLIVLIAAATIAAARRAD